MEFGKVEDFCSDMSDIKIPDNGIYLDTGISNNISSDIFVVGETVPNNTFEPIINNCAIFFHNNKGEKVGEFDFNTSPATFKGDVDKSAQIFVDNILKIWNLKKE